MSQTDENFVTAGSISLGALCITILLMFAPIAAHAHGGGLDDLGCHHNRKAGGYHCHRGALVGQQFRSKADALSSSLSLSQSRDTPPSTTAAITGKPRIIDGDTIGIGTAASSPSATSPARKAPVSAR